MSAKRILLTTGILAGIGGLVCGVGYLLGKKKVGDSLDTVTKVNVHSLNFKGLTLRIDVMLKNPTEGTLKLKQPYVKLLFENKTIGTSQISDTVIELPKYGAKALEPIYLSIPATGLLTLGDGLLKILTKNQIAKITTLTTTAIYIAGKYRSYSKQEITELKPKTKS